MNVEKFKTYKELFFNLCVSLGLIINVNIKDNILIINSENYAFSFFIFIPKNLTNILIL